MGYMIVLAMSGSGPPASTAAIREQQRHSRSQAATRCVDHPVSRYQTTRVVRAAAGWCPPTGAIIWDSALSSRARLPRDRELDNRTLVDRDVRSLRYLVPIDRGLVILGAEDEFLGVVAFAYEAWLRLCGDIERRGGGDWKRAAEGGTRALQ